MGIIFSDIIKKPLGVIFLVITAIVILALRGKIKRSSNLGRSILFVGDVYTFLRFIGFILAIIAIMFLILLSPKRKKHKQGRR